MSVGLPSQGNSKYNTGEQVKAIAIAQKSESSIFNRFLSKTFDFFGGHISS